MVNMERFQITGFVINYIALFLCVYWGIAVRNVDCAQYVESISAKQDLSLTFEEKTALDKFKQRVSSIVPHNYMKQDVYLIRWLRVRNLNLDAAESMLKENLRWRREQKMDAILQENWTDMKEDFPTTNDNFDKAGRPVGTTTLGHWDIRRAVLSGKLPRVQRYLNKILEEMEVRVRKEQGKGNEVTRWKLLINLDGFNQIQHACPLCLPLWANFAHSVQDYYPGLADQIIFINMPVIFNIILDFIDPILTPRARRVMVHLGQDKREWLNYLDKEISAAQRRPEFGGTLAD